MSILALPRPRAPLAPLPTPADLDAADRLAWLADGGDPDSYPGPGWGREPARSLRSRVAVRLARPGRRRPRRRAYPGDALTAVPARPDRMLHGIEEPGAYVQTFYTAAQWAALAPGDRPAHASYIGMLDAYQVLDRLVPWGDRPAAE